MRALSALLCAGAVLWTSATSASDDEASPFGDCYDVLVQARAVDQVPMDMTGAEDGDSIIVSWPYFVDLKIAAVLDGLRIGRRVTVLSVQHTYRRSGLARWWLRRNAAGSYNALPGGGDEPLRRCPADAPPAQPFIGASSATAMEKMRRAGVARWGHFPPRRSAAHGSSRDASP